MTAQRKLRPHDDVDDFFEAMLHPERVDGRSARGHDRDLANAVMKALGEGLSQKEAAQRTGTCQAHVSRIRRRIVGSPMRERSPIDRERLKELVEAGHVRKQIASMMGVSYPRICLAIREMELDCTASPVGSRPMSPAMLGEMVERGLSNTQIAADLGMSYGGAKTALDRAGLKARRGRPGPKVGSKRRGLS